MSLNLYLVRTRQSSKIYLDSRLKDLKLMSMANNKRCIDICNSKWNRISQIVCLSNLEDTPRKDSIHYLIRNLSIHRTCARSIKTPIINTRQIDICMKGKRLWISKLICTISNDICQETMSLLNCVLQCSVPGMTWCTWVLPTFEQCTTIDRAIRCTIAKCETDTWALLI